MHHVRFFPARFTWHSFPPSCALTFIILLFILLNQSKLSVQCLSRSSKDSILPHNPKNDRLDFPSRASTLQFTMAVLSQQSKHSLRSYSCQCKPQLPPKFSHIYPTNHTYIVDYGPRKSSHSRLYIPRRMHSQTMRQLYCETHSILARSGGETERDGL